MGQLFSKKVTKINVVIVGLQSSGKSTILENFKSFETRSKSTVPTVYFDFEIVKYKNLIMTLWDIDCDVRHPKLWRFLCKISFVLMFVVDSTDYERIEEAADELHSLLKFVDLLDAILMVVANKQDLPNAMGKTELTEKLRLKHITNRPWCVVKACGKTGKGLKMGFKWILEDIQKRDKISK